MDPRHIVGLQGEYFAERWLAKQGLRIVDRHYWTRFGEIDLIARDGDTWVFIEVKTRRKTWAVSALDAVTPAKQRRLAFAAYFYIRHKRLTGCRFRFDTFSLEAGVTHWIPNAFEAPAHWTL